MKPERWHRIEQLYHAAVERPANQRGAFLEDACADDTKLRSEVEMLIAANEQVGGFLATPALELEARNIADENESPTIGVQVGQELSHYTILSRIGSGGMGEVFLARDSVLERRVAIKVLPVQFTADAERLQRFVREAKAASALNHPNIITIHEIGEVATALGKTHFIATEFIEGETLRSWTVDEEKRVRQTLNVGVQVASALDAAHKAGIVHRDIKPENVMVRPDGLVKVLDFGLAKLIPQKTHSSDTSAPTLVDGMKTRPGVILGTLRYMSPEQARGGSVDTRSDIFSLGVVLYELLTGEPLFAGDTDADVVAAIIRKEAPPLTESLPDIPPELERVVQKALAKYADSRYQSADELRQALRSVRAVLPAEDSVPAKPTTFETRAAGARIVSVSSILRQPRVWRSVAGAIVAAAVCLAAARIWLRAAPHPPSPEAITWYEKGTRSLRDGAYYEASKRLERAILNGDDFVLAHARLAEAWTELDYSDKASKEILRARSLVGDLSTLPRLEGLYLKAITNIVLRKFEPAIKDYEQITRDVSDDQKAQAFLDLGRAYEKNDELEEAIDSYIEAKKRAPSEAAASLRLGILYGRKQNLSAAQEAFQEAENIYKDDSNDEGVSEVLYQRSRLLMDLRKNSEARSQLDQALRIATATNNQYQQVRAMFALSNVLVSEGQAIQAEEQATQAIELAQASGIENQATGGLIWLGNSFLTRGGYGDAEKYYKQALELARRNNGRENEAWALLQLGSLRSLQHEPDQSLSYIEQALPFYRQGGYRKNLSLALILKARVDRDRGDYPSAVQTFNELLIVAEQAGDQSQMAFSHEGIGNVLERQELYPEALVHFDRNYDLIRSLNAKVPLGYSGINRATVLWQIGSYEKAKAAIEEVLSIANAPEGRNKVLLAYVYGVSANLELSLQDFRVSIANSQQAINLAGTDYKDIAIHAKNTLGLAQARSGRARAGQLLCKDAVGLAMLTGDPHLLSSALLGLAEAMIENGEAQRALETAMQAQEILARFEMQESEWRALLIAARASQGLGDNEKAKDYSTRASEALARLEQKWGPEPFSGYRARPDIQQSLRELGRMFKR